MYLLPALQYLCCVSTNFYNCVSQWKLCLAEPDRNGSDFHGMKNSPGWYVALDGSFSFQSGFTPEISGFLFFCWKNLTGLELDVSQAVGKWKSNS